jgi:type 1 fimbria pilin
MMQTFNRALHSNTLSGTRAASHTHVQSEVRMTRFVDLLSWVGHASSRWIGSLLLLMSLLVLLPTTAEANCAFTGGTNTSAVTFTPPATITVAYNAAVGTILYTSPLIPPAVAPQINCTGTTNYGVRNEVGATPGTTVDVYPTSISGLSYSITHNDLTTYLYPYPCCQLAAGAYSASIDSSLQLIKTGPIVSGSVLPAGLLGYWEFDPGIYVESFTLGNSVTIIDPACSVNTTPINVTLPTIPTSSLGAVGATAGSTPFTIALTCASGATLDITLNYAGTASGITGVLTKTAGTSAGVGVQLLNQSSAPVSFGTTTVVGATPNGALNIPYYAQYYRTAAVTAGTLTASATFTITYQ